MESMSKSKKNVIDPESIINTFGADSARWFMLSDSPPEKDINWSESGINGAWKICHRIWTLINTNKKHFETEFNVSDTEFSGKSLNLIRLIHQNLDQITKSIERFQMNVAIAKVFEMVNAISKFEITNKHDVASIKESLEILVRVIEPMVPHLAEECWSLLNNKKSLSDEPWPKVNLSYLTRDEVNVVIQINGKRRGEVIVSKDASEEDVWNEIKNIKNINDALHKKNIIKSIYVPNRILNVVIENE